MFRATSESQDVCAACLEEEFGIGRTAVDAGRENLMKEHTQAFRRQKARADKVGRTLRSSSAFSLKGHVRCALAVCLFLVCVFMFLISDGEHVTFLNQLEYEYQLSISLGVALISSALLIPSYTRHKMVVGIFWVVMLMLGGTMPSMWHYRVPETQDYTHTVASGASDGAAEKASDKLFTEHDLAFFTDWKQRHPRDVNYCIFVRCDLLQNVELPGVIAFGRMEQSTRNLIKNSLSRLLHGAKVEINNSSNGRGVIFTVLSVPAQRENITSLLNRYGQVYYSEPAEGVYEVELDPAKVSVGMDVDTTVLLDAQHPSFPELNMKALRSLDAEIVRAAANRLADADVNRLRGDICNCLADVLRYPWGTTPDTYNALVEAFVVYAADDDSRVAPILWAYFQNNIKARRGVSQPVALRLARVAPDKMSTPVRKLWLANPAAWNDVAGVLADTMEPFIIERLQGGNLSVKEIADCLNYLQPFGTSASLPVLQSYVEHRDKAIARKANNTIETIRNRQK